jgi:hypothetical protein
MLYTHVPHLLAHLLAHLQCDKGLLILQLRAADAERLQAQA